MHSLPNAPISSLPRRLGMLQSKIQVTYVSNTEQLGQHTVFFAVFVAAVIAKR